MKTSIVIAAIFIIAIIAGLSSDEKCYSPDTDQFFVCEGDE